MPSTARRARTRSCASSGRATPRASGSGCFIDHPVLECVHPGPEPVGRVPRVEDPRVAVGPGAMSRSCVNSAIAFATRCRWAGSRCSGRQVRGGTVVVGTPDPPGVEHRQQRPLAVHVDHPQRPEPDLGVLPLHGRVALVRLDDDTASAERVATVLHHGPHHGTRQAVHAATVRRTGRGRRCHEQVHADVPGLGVPTRR